MVSNKVHSIFLTFKKLLISGDHIHLLCPYGIHNDLTGSDHNDADRSNIETYSPVVGSKEI